VISRLFPRQMDNNYEGHWLAIVLLAPLVLLKLLMGFNVAGLNPWLDNRHILKNTDGVPIDAFSVEATNFLVFMFSAWGLSLFVLSLLGVIVLMRYRAMIPLMYLLLTIEQVGRKWLSVSIPLERAGDAAGTSPGVWINWGLSAALMIGLVLSLTGGRKRGITV